MESERTSEQSNQNSLDATPIDTIPSDVLVPILNSLPYKDRLTGARVSSRWHRIIDQRLGRKLFIGRPCQFPPPDEERYKHNYVPIEALGSVGANTCYFGEIVDSRETWNPLKYWYHRFWETFYGPSPLPTFKNPNLVQNIFFDGPIPAEYFRNVIRPVRCLDRLDLHTSTLAFLSPEDMDLSHLRQLGTINVWGHRLTQGMFTQFLEPAPIIPNLIEIWNKNYFPNLTKMSVEYPFDLIGNEYALTEKLLEFLKRHKRTLQVMRLVVNCYLAEDSRGSESEAAFIRRWTEKTKAVSHQLSLQHVELEIVTLSQVTFYRIWILLVEEQTKLETISIVCFNLNPNILPRICQKNSQTMKKLTLTRLTFSEHEMARGVTFSPLQNCTKLTTLNIEGMHYWDDPTRVQMAAGITGAEYLPQSLKCIDISGIVLKAIDTHYILTQLMNLQEVQLNSVGRHSDDFGVTTATMQEVISTRRIGKVSLFHCLIDGIPRPGFPNGNPDNPSVIKGERSYRSVGGFINMELGEDGYYRDKIIPRRSAVEDLIDLEEWEGS